MWPTDAHPIRRIMHFSPFAIIENVVRRAVHSMNLTSFSPYSRFESVNSLNSMGKYVWMPGLVCLFNVWSIMASTIAREIFFHSLLIFLRVVLQQVCKCIKYINETTKNFIWVFFSFFYFDLFRSVSLVNTPTLISIPYKPMNNECLINYAMEKIDSCVKQFFFLFNFQKIDCMLDRETNEQKATVWSLNDFSQRHFVAFSIEGLWIVILNK